MLRENPIRIAKTRCSGLIWSKAPSVRSRIVRRVCQVLENVYGRPWHGNLHDPLDELIYIILSNRTSIEVAQTTFAKIKTIFLTWESTLNATPLRLRKILGPAGLSQVKSRQIRSALRKIRRDFGSCDLSQLRNWQVDEAEAYLISLPGVSSKVAKCVLLYTCDACVLPVDTHVHRIAKRLGWIDRRRADQCHEELEALVPAQRRLAFHVDCIAHGRAICRHNAPCCKHCCLRRYCEYYKSLRIER